MVEEHQQLRSHCRCCNKLMLLPLRNCMYLERCCTPRGKEMIPRYSFAFQAVVDHRGLFTEMFLGSSGTNDEILERSPLYKRAIKGGLEDVRIVGDSSYPLHDWLLVPYTTNQNLNFHHQIFNEEVQKIEMVARDAFAKLKGRWSCLQKRLGVARPDLIAMALACATLHNLCECRGDKMDVHWQYKLFDEEMVANTVPSPSSVRLRDEIAANCWWQP